MFQPISPDSSGPDCSHASAIFALIVVVSVIWTTVVPQLTTTIAAMTARVVSVLP